MNMDPGTWSARVAAVVRAEMASQLRTGEALAAVLGVDERSIATRLDGGTRFDLVEIERVAVWLGVTPSELLARADRRATWLGDPSHPPHPPPAQEDPCPTHPAPRHASGTERSS